jgi:hypothetical protein
MLVIPNFHNQGIQMRNFPGFFPNKFSLLGMAIWFMIILLAIKKKEYQILHCVRTKHVVAD